MPDTHAHAAGDHMHHQAGHEHTPSGVGTHGMLVVGTDPVYLSHLPMFHPPHNHQLLLQATLTHDDEDAAGVYRSDREAHPETLYTFEPEQFALRDLLEEFPQPAKRTSFTGTLYRGHFERGGRPLLRDVTVVVDRVTYHHELDAHPHPAHSTDRDLTYRSFGTSSQMFLAHEITTAPNFDHVLEVHFDDADVAGSAPEGPVAFAGRGDGPDERLRAGEEVTGFFFQSIGPRGQHGFRSRLTVDREVYLESGELAG